MKEFPSLRLEAYLLVCALITSFERNNHCAADLTPFEGEELRAITQESQQDSGVDHDSKGFRFRRLENSGNDYEKMFRESTEGTEELETDETETEATYEKDEGIGEHTPGLLVAGKGEHSTQIGSKHINYAVIVLLLCGLVVICQLGLLTFLLTKFIIAVKDEMVPTDKEKKPKKTKKAKSKEDTKTKGKGKGKKSSPAPLPSPSGEPKKSSETETGEA
nr:unnamed protein product [Haemonchus contortus]